MILLMAGTSEGRELAGYLAGQGYPLLVTTVSAYAGTLIAEGIECISRPLGVTELEQLILKKRVKVLIDATHPYAVEASHNAAGAAKLAGITYLRWERDGTQLDVPGPVIHQVSSFQDALPYLEPYERILLTIGSKELREFAGLILHPGKKVYVRVLPLPASLQTCWDLGVPAGQIIACQGPFSAEWNLAMLQQYQIEVLLTKDSGQRGGVDAKLKAAQEWKIPVVMIQKPTLTYARQIHTLEELEDELHKAGLSRANLGSHSTGTIKEVK